MTGAPDGLSGLLCSSDIWAGAARLGVAVSGGGDSLALLYLMADCAPRHGVALAVATVDHGLRPEAAQEAAFVAETCACLGLPHATLRWQGWSGAGNLQAEARAARGRLLAGWARAEGLDAVALGHTRDDQAETFLLRLARGSGVDGLAAMAPRSVRHGVPFLRPLLGVARAELRGWLAARGLRWIDDPSNDDARFDRVKARAALAALAPLGLGPERLAATAGALARARAALEAETLAAARALCRTDRGDVLIEAAGLAALPEEIRLRLLAHALRWVSGAPYRPRLDALASLAADTAGGAARTLHGCLVSPGAGGLRIAREAAAVAGLDAAPGALWDGRWRLVGAGQGLRVRALGDAVAACPGWRAAGLPRASLMASPALWDGARLVAAPLAGFGQGVSATIDPPGGDFFTSVLSH